MSNNGDFAQFFADDEPDQHPLNFETKAFLNLFQAWLEEHDREVHDGEPCAGERAGIIAFIAHRIGMTPEAWELVPETYAYYKEQHDAGHRET